ncbi:MAG: hypothetical protein AAF542_11585 [Pseudomonadota bacterium]
MKQAYSVVSQHLENLSKVFSLHASMTQHIPANHVLSVTQDEIALAPLSTQSTLNRKTNEN